MDRGSLRTTCGHWHQDSGSGSFGSCYVGDGASVLSMVSHRTDAQMSWDLDLGLLYSYTVMSKKKTQ